MPPPRSLRHHPAARRPRVSRQHVHPPATVPRADAERHAGHETRVGSRSLWPLSPAAAQADASARPAGHSHHPVALHQAVPQGHTDAPSSRQILPTGLPPPAHAPCEKAVPAAVPVRATRAGQAQPARRATARQHNAKPAAGGRVPHCPGYRPSPLQRTGYPSLVAGHDCAHPGCVRRLGQQVNRSPVAALQLSVAREHADGSDLRMRAALQALGFTRAEQVAAQRCERSRSTIRHPTARQQLRSQFPGG